MQVWCIPLHYHLQFFDQLIETGTRARFLFPAVSHQLISVIEKNKKTKKQTNQLKLVRVPINYYTYKHRFSDLVKEVSFRPAGSHSFRITRRVGFLPSLRASSPFGGSRQVHAPAARERKHDSAGPPARAFSRGSFPSPKWRACSQANSCFTPYPSLCRHKIEYKAIKHKASIACQHSLFHLTYQMVLE